MIALTLGCAVACVVLVVAEWRGARWLRIAAKLAASAAFVAVLFAATDGGPDDPRWIAYGRAIAIGIMFGAIGDAALLGSSRRSFLLGLVAFLLGHLAYVAGIASIVPADRWLAEAGGYVVLPVAAVAVVLAGMWPRLGAMRAPVVAYVITITAMVIAAIAAWRGHALPEPNRDRLIVGACLFFASDIAVARDRFIRHRFSNKLWGLPTYYAGQLLFAWSVAGL